MEYIESGYADDAFEYIEYGFEDEPSNDEYVDGAYTDNVGIEGFC